GIQIKVRTSDDHRALSSYLRKERISFHTYTLQEERELRAVIRGIPKELDAELVKADLLEQGLPVNSVHRMHTGRGREPYNMVLVALQPTPEGKQIFNIRTVCSLSGIAVETPHKKGTPSQCHNCQLYGHSSRNCHARPRCVKCLGDHATALCTRDQKTATEPPSCVLCRTQGHPANYRGCPRAPKINRRVARQNRLRASGPDIKASAPSVSQAKPAFVPAPVPSVSAWAKPLPYMNTATTPSSAIRPAPATRPSPATCPPTASDNLALAIDFFQSINFERVNALGDAIRAASTAQHFIAVVQEYADVYASLNTYVLPSLRR
ncbi:hypothetical protein F3H11_32070, partial [Pseudomonas aeruginosa]